MIHYPTHIGQMKWMNIMREIEGEDIWDAVYGNMRYHPQIWVDGVVITTNGFVKQNGEAVMGRGIALQAKKRFPAIPFLLGEKLQEYGNIPFIFTNFFAPDMPLITMPVKPAYGPKGEPGWLMKADPKLIRISAEVIAVYADDKKLKNIVMPRPGCGNGGLKWDQVKPLLEPILDDRFIVIQN